MRCLPLDPEGKDLSTQNLDYFTLRKQERKNNVMIVAKNILQFQRLQCLLREKCFLVYHTQKRLF